MKLSKIQRRILQVMHDEKPHNLSIVHPTTRRALENMMAIGVVGNPDEYIYRITAAGRAAVGGEERGT